MISTACSAILGFEDRSLDPSIAANGNDANGDGTTGGDGSTTDGGPVADGDLVPPTNVIASKVEAIGEVTTLAGSGTADFKDGQGIVASFKQPYGVVVEPSGNIIVADPGNSRIRKITPSGMTTTLAGSGVDGWGDDPNGAIAKFSTPGGLAVDTTGNIFVPEYGNNRIRMVTPAGAVTTVAGTGAADWVDGTGDMAAFNHPIAAAADMNGNIYVADFGNNRIRKVTPTGIVSTLAGSGVATFAEGTGDQASFSTPAGIAVTASGDAVYVSDNGNNRIRKITQTGEVTTMAGSGQPAFADGKGASASLNNPTGIAVHPITGDIFFCDSGNSRIRRMTADGTVTTIAGQALNGYVDGKGPIAQFYNLQGLALDTGVGIYVADRNNHRIRKISVGGIGYLDVSWTAPATTGGASIVSYTATAAAAGQTSKSCMTSSALKCTINGLKSGVPYSVTVTATNGVATSAPSTASVAAPN